MISKIRNLTVNRNRYREHGEAVIISCFFNPQKSPYRLKAFNIFYDSIKHLNHLIVECVVGDTDPQLEETENIIRVHTENLLWHKESLLNLAVAKLPARYRYVFWIDADVIFTNLNWLVDSVKEFKNGAKILQPFEYCIHMERDELEPSFSVEDAIDNMKHGDGRHPKLWRSSCANFVDSPCDAASNDYNTHGHVGFAWGATRDLLEKVPLYDKALIGGADHIIFHAAAGQIPHPCIDKSFTDDLDNVYEWSKKFYAEAQGKIAYSYGNLYHIWHGDIEKRQYLKRIKEFTPETKKIVEKDKNGLYVTKSGDSPYMKKYFNDREVHHYHNGGYVMTNEKYIPAHLNDTFPYYHSDSPVKRDNDNSKLKEINASENFS